MQVVMKMADGLCKFLFCFLIVGAIIIFAISIYVSERVYVCVYEMLSSTRQHLIFLNISFSVIIFIY